MKIIKKRVNVLIIITVIFYAQLIYAGYEETNGEIQIYLKNNRLYVENILPDESIDVTRIEFSNDYLMAEGTNAKIESGKNIFFELKPKRDLSVRDIYKEIITVFYVTESGYEDSLDIEIVIGDQRKLIGDPSVAFSVIYFVTFGAVILYYYCKDHFYHTRIE